MVVVNVCALRKDVCKVFKTLATSLRSLLTQSHPEDTVQVHTSSDCGSLSRKIMGFSVWCYVLYLLCSAFDIQTKFNNGINKMRFAQP